MPSKRFCYPCSEFPGYTYVNYTSPRRAWLTDSDRKTLADNFDDKIYQEQKRMNDPVYVHRKANAEHNIGWARRIRRDPRYLKLVSLEPHYWEEYPTDSSVYCQGCQHYIRRSLIRDSVCKYCMNLPIPVPEGQNWDPLILDSRPRDEHGNLIDRQHAQKSGRPRMSDEAIRLSKVDSAEIYISKKFDDSFINTVVKKRLEFKLTQDELAQMVNRSVKDIRSFEKGELAFDPALKSQLVWKLEI